MKATIHHPDGTVIEFEGTPAEYNLAFPKPVKFDTTPQITPDPWWLQRPLQQPYIQQPNGSGTGIQWPPGTIVCGDLDLFRLGGGYGYGIQNITGPVACGSTTLASS